MKLNLLILLSFIVSFVSASRYVLVFETGKSTPKDLIQEIKSTIESFGGRITYNYELTITGFSFDLPKSLNSKLESISSKFSSKEYPFFIEEDSSVTS